MTNGYIDIKIGAETYGLFFGRQSVEEFARRTEKYLSDNSFKIATDMVFSGMANYATKHELPVLPYEQVYDLMEEFSDQEDYNAQYAKVAETFWESKYGSDYREKLEELKKKVETEIEDLKEKAAQPPNTGTD